MMTPFLALPTHEVNRITRRKTSCLRVCTSEITPNAAGWEALLMLHRIFLLGVTMSMIVFLVFVRSMSDPLVGSARATIAVTKSIINVRCPISPSRTCPSYFSVVTCKNTTLTALTIDARAGYGIAKNTAGFGLTMNDHVPITRTRSTTKTIVVRCSLVPIPSSATTIVVAIMVFQSDLVVETPLTNNDSGYVNHQLKTVKKAVVIHSDYSRTNGGLQSAANSQVQITFFFNLFERDTCNKKANAFYA
ncbi:unnamed protein product [Peronospora farinosa]|uniref:Uncharacterized protein n=1 Tax=Peronospora farinosa TaxID=134698 RepID=A0AAV0TTT7_9STRA|nr:unnamed protein product [Peronospora farinosa]